MERECQIDKVEYISIKPDGVCLYNQRLGSKSKYVNVSEYINNSVVINKPPDFKRPDQKMSRRAVGRMKLAIQWLLYLSRTKRQYSRDLKKWIPFRINFITLTLCSKQMHTDNEIKKQLLHQFLVEMKTATGMKEYIWRAEKQKNGNIHFHILTNVWVDHSALRARWNRIQNKLGYVDRYAEEQQREIKNFTDYYNKYLGYSDYMTLARRYNENLRTGWRSPNSTDVHSIKRIKNIEAYLCKYMCKEAFKDSKISEKEGEELIVQGKLWGLSERLSQLRNVTAVVTGNIIAELNEIFKKIKFRVYNSDYFQWLGITLKDIYRQGSKELIGIVENRLVQLGFKLLVAT